jgi:hypothetical protein
MREVLKEAKLTQYNDNCSKLIKNITGRAPPQPDCQALRRFCVKFNKIVDLLDLVKDPDNNRPYYPFFIYKIIEDEAINLSKRNQNKSAKELYKLLSYIHLQSDDTIKKNDNTYKQICEISIDVDELTYRPTERPDEL